ncbi:MAG: hypothetical protein QMD95_02730 [Candidatus Hodarchaeaceae archaeon]|nr:hypothetical protein [Candidatus Hodarchaeaceae archaeon]
MKKMLGNDQRGVAAITVIVILVISTGAGLATPVIVDVVDVDPDSPFYGLERLGERMRMVSTEDQMRERWGEYARLVDRAKGLEYKHILEEFVDRMQELAPGDTAAKQEIVQWMQDQMPGIGRVQLKMFKELCKGLKDELPEVSEKIDTFCYEIENCERELDIAELRENVQARMRLIREKIENIVRQHRARITRPVNKYFDIDNILVDVNVTVDIEVNLRPIPITAPSFEEKLKVFNNLLAEVQAMLAGAPENAVGKHAAERLVEVATTLKDRAVSAYNEGKVRRALGLIRAAIMHIYNAKMILEHASEWEPEFREGWAHWMQDWAEVKQTFIGEGIWESVLKNYQQYAENIRQRWEERMR